MKLSQADRNNVLRIGEQFKMKALPIYMLLAILDYQWDIKN
jgi:hypothetical protein